MSLTSPNVTEGRFAALRTRDFRLFWSGHVVSVAGQQILWVAQGWLIYEVTGSKLLLGAAALAEAVPAILLALFGGVLADKVNQRRLLITVYLVQFIVLLGLATLAFGQIIQAWHVIASMFILSAVGSFENPTRQAMFARLVPRQSLTSAVALNSMVHPGTGVLAPVIGGFILAQVLNFSSSAMLAAGTVFTLSALGQGAYALLLWAVRLPPVYRAQGKRFLSEMADGIRIVMREPAFAILIVVTYFTMFFALSMSVLFPVFAKDILHVGPSGLGLMYTAVGIGSLVGAFWSENFTSSIGRGRSIVAGFLILSVLLILFTVSTWYPLSLLLLALASIGGAVSYVAIQSALQLKVEDEYRGRVMGFWGMTHTCIRPLGQMQLAGMAALVSAPFALALGGSLVIAFVLLVVARSSAVQLLPK